MAEHKKIPFFGPVDYFGWACIAVLIAVGVAPNISVYEMAVVVGLVAAVGGLVAIAALVL